ncbi:MAG: prepilin-type N-terminal cleavage/methylation domain-containing protein [Patescibacteria group bacterium]
MKVPWRGQAGFTLIEMITVLMVIGVLTALILVNTLTGNRRQELRDSAAEFVNQARNAEARASAAEPVDGTSRKAYGVCLTSTGSSDGSGTFPDSTCAPPQGQANAYQVYARTEADTDANPELDEPPDDPNILSSHELPGDVRLFSFGQFYLDYAPPQPTMFVNGGTSNRTLYVFSSKANYYRIIQVRPKSGAVYVQ